MGLYAISQKRRWLAAKQLELALQGMVSHPRADLNVNFSIVLQKLATFRVWACGKPLLCCGRQDQERRPRSNLGDSGGEAPVVHCLFRLHE